MRVLQTVVLILVIRNSFKANESEQNKTAKHSAITNRQVESRGRDGLETPYRWCERSSKRAPESYVNIATIAVAFMDGDPGPVSPMDKEVT
jgi:hypothetical protein